jgi:nucleoside-diphosphate-sugar epimerase
LVGRQYNYLAEKARVELGYFPQIELLEGVREAVRSMRVPTLASSTF